MTFTKLIALPILSMALVACDGLQNKPNRPITATEKVNKNYSDTQLPWVGRPIPGFIMKWDAKMINGEINICGAITYPMNDLRLDSRDVVKRAYVKLNGKEIMRDMRFFNVVDSEKELQTATANCANSGAKLTQNKNNIFLTWDRGSVRR